MIASVVAVDQNWGIGSKGDLLVHIPEDMKHFKEITSGHSVVMGRKTYDSLPKKPLPKRTNIIVTSKANNAPILQDDNSLLSNMEYIKVWLSSPNVIKDNDGIYVIGGGMIYNELLQFCERVYITKVLKSYDNADTFFPNIDKMPEWDLSSTSEIKEYDGIKYQFCIYDRIDYDILKVQTHDDNKEIDRGDMVITVRTFNGIKTVILSTKAKKCSVYIDNWDYLEIKDNMTKFVNKVGLYIKAKKEV